MPVTVLLANTNWWPCSAHVAISLKNAGAKVAAVYPSHGHPLAKTGAVSARFIYRATSPLLSLTKAIRDSGADWILPCDDRSVSHLHQLHSKAVSDGDAGKPVTSLIERSLGSPAAFSIVSSRAALLRNAQAETIPVPEMSEVVTLEQLRHLSETKSYPWVMKVDGSCGGLGVKVVRSLNEAEACFRQMREPLGTLPMLKRLFANRDAFWIETWWRRQRRGITVQSYVEGRPANCAVFCRNGKVLAAIAVEVVAAQAAMGPATIVRIVDGHQMLDAAKALVGRLNLSGFHGLDFISEDKTGIAYLIEMNPRCAMPCHLRLGGDRDLIGSLYSELSNQPPIPSPLVLGGDIVSYFPQAWLSDPKCDALRTGYHDVPWQEPELLKELLLLPWPDRSFLARTSDRFRNLTYEQRSARGAVFQSLPTAGHGVSTARGRVMRTSRRTRQEFSSVVPIRPDGSAPPLFFIHGVGGVIPDFGTLLDELDSRHPVYGVQAQAFDPEGPTLLTLEEMASSYLRDIRRSVSHGPYYLIGFSFGGMVAFEMAQQMRAQGEERPIIAMIDSCEMSYLKRQAKFDPAGQRARDIYHQLKRRFGEAFERPDTFSYMKEKIESRMRRIIYAVSSKFGISISSSFHRPYHVNWFAAVNYLPKPYDEKFYLFKAKNHFWEPRIPPDLGWGPLALKGVEIFEISGDHTTMFLEPNVSVLGDHLARCFETASVGARQD